MRRTVVWKAALDWPAALQPVVFPASAELLTVQLQHGRPCIWARVDPNMPAARYMIRICGTGHTIPADAGEYLGTFQVDGGDLIFHAFGRREDDATIDRPRHQAAPQPTPEN